MTLRLSWEGRVAAGEVVAALREWEAPGGWGRQLHAGDVGWHLRLPDEEVEGSLLVGRDDGSVAAVGLLDGPAVLRLAVRPALAGDASVGAALADAAVDRLGPGEAYVDGPAEDAWRVELARHGWDVDPDPWVHLWRPLEADDAHADPSGVGAVSGQDDVQDRVAVQRAAFEGSTFTVEAWQRMSSSPAYDASLDLLARDDEGTPVAALTAWSAGTGACALVEPMGTAREHRGHGHGRRLLVAAMAALARSGASGVAVWTPAGNEAALATYRSAGFAGVGLSSAMCSTAASTSSAQPQESVTPAPPWP